MNYKKIQKIKPKLDKLLPKGYHDVDEFYKEEPPDKLDSPDLRNRAISSVNGNNRCPGCKYFCHCEWLKEGVVCIGKSEQIVDQIQALYSGKIEEAKQEERELLIMAESYFDKLNGEYGNEKELCLYCHSSKVYGLGIDHEDNCLVSLIRQALSK